MCIDTTYIIYRCIDTHQYEHAKDKGELDEGVQFTCIVNSSLVYKPRWTYSYIYIHTYLDGIYTCT